MAQAIEAMAKAIVALATHMLAPLHYGRAKLPTTLSVDGLAKALASLPAEFVRVLCALQAAGWGVYLRTGIGLPGIGCKIGVSAVGLATRPTFFVYGTREATRVALYVNRCDRWAVGDNGVATESGLAKALRAAFGARAATYGAGKCETVSGCTPETFAADVATVCGIVGARVPDGLHGTQPEAKATDKASKAKSATVAPPAK